MTIFATASLLLIIAILLLAWRYHYINYPDPNGQLSRGDFSDQLEDFDGDLRVVTWNLHFGENLDEGIESLQNAHELQVADIILLQEIDSMGVDEIAERLKLNYIYYPTVYSRKRQKEFGLAILSKWSLKDAEIILLPNWFPGWIENRYAIKADVALQEKKFTVYNTHLDLAWMEPQGKFLAEAMTKQDGPVILGGDFNTWRPGSISFLEDKLQQARLERLTEGTGHTFRFNNLKFTLDHIFSMEGLNASAETYRKTDASDHYPVWVEIELKED